MSTALSANLMQSSNDDLVRLRAKLLRLRAKQDEAHRLTAEQFRAKYPTPGALAQAYQPRTKQTPALDAIDAALVELAEAPEDRGRTQIFMSPQEGKSSRVSCWFPLWMLAQDPSLRIAIVSYSAEKAQRWGKWLRRMIEAHPELGIGLMADSRAVDNYETTAGGRVLSVGVSGGITGEPVDVMVIDDPVRGRAEAESPTYREAAWDWWESNGSTRLSARGRVVLMMTRWHADDLAGRLIDREPGVWRVLRIPAVRDPRLALVRGRDGASVYAPNGELISVQRRRPGYFLELKSRRSLYVWNSIYMQTPVAAEGNLFHRDDFRYWTAMYPDRSHHDPTGGRQIMVNGVRRYVGDMTRFITVDLAASVKTSADFTVAAVWGITLDGELILLDRARERIGESAHWAMLAPLCHRWACPDVYVEKGFIGSTLTIDATRAGIRIQPVTPDKDKITRALPATQRVKAHSVYFPDSSVYDWHDEWCDEIAGFPTWPNDDQTDVLAYAARIASAHWSPPARDPDRGRSYDPVRRTDDELAYEAATGMVRPMDFMSAVW
jgi:predicted phage terminase large subunit-like protein